MTEATNVTAALVLLAMSANSAQATIANYHCNGGTRLTAVFSPPGLKAGRVVLNIAGDRKVTLPQQMSADGGRYANGSMEFWIKGNGATLTRDGRSETCQSR
jgi:membrane-bound inhibitor of C-type lysozyme